MEQLYNLNVKQLSTLLSWYRIQGRARMTIKDEKIQALSNIPEVVNNVQQIVDNKREIFTAIYNAPKRRANSPQPPLPIPRNTQHPPPPINRTKPPRPPPPKLYIPPPKQMPGTPPGSPDLFRPETPPGSPPPRPTMLKPQPLKNTKTKQTPFIGNILNKFWNYVKPYIPEKVKHKTEELAKNFIERYKKVNQPKELKSSNKSKKAKRDKDSKNKGNNKDEEFSFNEQKRALKGYLKSYRIDGKKGYGPKRFINNIKPKVLNLINQKNKPIKVKFIFTCKFIKENPATRQIDENLGYFHSKVETITLSTDFSELFNMMTNRQLELSEQFQNQGSGWQFDQVEYFDINIDPFEPFVGSSYIKLPSKLAEKKAIINVKNENDHECFKWAVTSAVYIQNIHPERLNKQMIENSNNFDWSKIEFPVSVKQIDKFEKQNPYYVINVYGYDKGDVYPLRISKKQKGYLINLLLISEDENNHYCWIKNISRLLASKVSKHKSKMHFCHRCLNAFQSETSLEKHIEYCVKNEEVKIVMPMDKEGFTKYIKFNNLNRKMRVPFVVYADFECITEK